MKDMAVKSLPKYDADWDFDTLARANEIQSDKKRYGAAMKAGNARLKEQQQRVNAMQKALGGKVSRKK